LGKAIRSWAKVPKKSTPQKKNPKKKKKENKKTKNKKKKNKNQKQKKYDCSTLFLAIDDKTLADSTTAFWF